MQANKLILQGRSGHGCSFRTWRLSGRCGGGGAQHPVCLGADLEEITSPRPLPSLCQWTSVWSELSRRTGFSEIGLPLLEEGEKDELHLSLTTVGVQSVLSQGPWFMNLQFCNNPEILLLLISRY